jgi:hypothetical protein
LDEYQAHALPWYDAAAAGDHARRHGQSTNLNRGRRKMKKDQ